MEALRAFRQPRPLSPTPLPRGERGLWACQTGCGLRPSRHLLQQQCAAEGRHARTRRACQPHWAVAQRPARGKAAAVHPLLWVVAVLFVAYFAIVPLERVLT